MDGAVSGYSLDRARITLLGLSNGANFAAALLALHPNLVQRAILLRAMPVLETLPDVDLTSTDVLLMSGDRDLLATNTERLDVWLRETGADVVHQHIDAGHELTKQDQDIARDWLSQRA